MDLTKAHENDQNGEYLAHFLCNMIILHENVSIDERSRTPVAMLHPTSAFLGTPLKRYAARLPAISVDV